MRLNRRLQSVVRKEAREIYRDKLYLAMAFVVPVFLKILFGYGLTLDVKNIPTAVLDWNRSPASREYVDRVGRSRYFTLERYLLDYGPIYQGLLKGRLRLGLIIPPDFDRTLALGQETEVQALIDGSFPDRALTSRSYLEAINLEFNQELARRWQSSTGSMPPWIEVDTRAWFNSDLESKNFIVPGLMVTTLFFYPALLASIAIVREKESGSIFNIYCSPIRRWEYVIGKLLPYLGIGLINYVMIFLLSDYLFDVPFRGSFVFLTLAALYESWPIPLAILMTMPLGVIGGVLATGMRGYPNDVYFQIGLLITLGLTTKNAILIVQFAMEGVEEEGMELIPAALRAVKLRLRPILMTSLTTGIAVLPMAFSTGAGAGAMVAIGTVVMGGMFTGTILVVMFAPLFYVLIEQKFGKRRKAKANMSVKTIKA